MNSEPNPRTPRERWRDFYRVARIVLRRAAELPERTRRDLVGSLCGLHTPWRWIELLLIEDRMAASAWTRWSYRLFRFRSTEPVARRLDRVDALLRRLAV